MELDKLDIAAVMIGGRWYKVHGGVRFHSQASAGTITHHEPWLSFVATDVEGETYRRVTAPLSSVQALESSVSKEPPQP
jgi:hypothetical protein